MAALLLAFATAAWVDAKPPVYTLVLPDGFEETAAKDKWGFGLISRRSVREWRHPTGVRIRFTIDNSVRATNREISANARYYLEEIREQSADVTIVSPARYTVGGKEWVGIPVKARDPEKKPDMMVLITEFNRMVALVQVGGRREAWDDVKRLTADLMRLNSPPEESGRVAASP